MKVYIVSLKNGGAIIAKDYYELSETEYRFKCISFKHDTTYTYDVLKNEINDIEIKELTKC